MPYFWCKVWGRNTIRIWGTYRISHINYDGIRSDIELTKTVGL